MSTNNRDNFENHDNHPFHKNSSEIKLYKDLHTHSTQDLRQFKWDNLDAYYVKEEKEKNKPKKDLDHKPKVTY